MREEHKVKVQGGKEHVTWAGLLDMAHERFDSFAIDTSFHGFFGDFAVSTAEFRGFKDEQMVVKTSGIGDASPENVGRNIAPHLIRMSETRAKGRALRDALNIGEAIAEELTQGSSEPRGGGSKPQQRPGEATTRTQGSDTNSHMQRVPEEAVSSEEGALRATRDQINELTNLMGIRAKQTQESPKELRESFVEFIGFPIKDLSRGEAQKYIRSFEVKIENHKEAKEEEAS